jgi:actin-like ATPase involved in cell morphogenesis
MGVSEIRRLKRLEEEHTKLKRLVTESPLSAVSAYRQN